MNKNLLEKVKVQLTKALLVQHQKAVFKSASLKLHNNNDQTTNLIKI
jgi:hypothetical protein